MHNFKELKIWQKSLALSKTIYLIVSNFPAEEKYGMKSQIQRSTVSIPSNIAEGSSRSSELDFNRFLNIALGSSFELETQLILASEFGFISNEVLNNVILELNEIQKMIRGFSNQLVIKK